MGTNLPTDAGVLPVHSARTFRRMLRRSHNCPMPTSEAKLARSAATAIDCLYFWCAVKAVGGGGGVTGAIDETLRALIGATEDMLYDAVHLLSARRASNDDFPLISLWARMWRHGKRNVHRHAHVHESSVTVSGPSGDGTGAPAFLGNWTVPRLAISARTWPYACEVSNPS